MARRTVTVTAGAKVNPRLVIHGRRADGFHELTTLMLGLDLRDEVTVSLVPGAAQISVRSTGPFATPDIVADETNLAVRGVRAALDGLGQPETALHITLHKGIPSRAGLGGGSADAAAAALGTLELLAPDRPHSVDTAVTRALGHIGADCAFFFAARQHGAARSSGRGEHVEPIAATPPWHVALLTPEIDCATPKVYAALDLAVSSPEELRASARTSNDGSQSAALWSAAAADARALLRNDLEEPAERAFPELRSWRALFQHLGLDHFRLAGSGSSFFGLFDSEAEAESVLDDVRAEAAARHLGLRHAAVHRPAGDQLLALLDAPSIP